MPYITPERGFVLVRLVKKDPLEMGRTKIAVPDTGRKEPQLAKLIAVGEAAFSDDGVPISNEHQFKAGDFVYFGKWQGMEIVLAGELHKLVEARMIYGIVRLTDEELAQLHEENPSFVKIPDINS